MGISDAQAVVGHGNALVGSAAVTVLHLPFVQHAAAAVDDKPVRGQVCGKFRAAGPGKSEIFSGKFPDPFRQFFRADVATLAVVGAAFGDEDPVAVLQKLKTMLDAGLIPQEVYDKKMQEVLSRM